MSEGADHDDACEDGPPEPAGAGGREAASPDGDPGSSAGVPDGGDGSEAVTPDGGVAGNAYTVRLELDDEPGELLAALSPIAENGGNLLSIFHERGNLTPRGRVPVEVDLEAPPGRFEDIVAALREAGVNVVRAGEERYAEAVTVLLVGHVVDTDLSDTLQRLSDDVEGSVSEVSLSAPDGTEEVSSARVRLRVPTDGAEEALATLRSVAEEKDLRVVEPLLEADR